MVGRHIMVLWLGHAPWFLCYQLDFLLDFFTEEGSYQGLKDATSFGLLSDKSAEILGWKYLNFRQIHDSAIFGLGGHGLNCPKSAESDITSGWNLLISLEIVTFRQDWDHNR